MDSVPNAINEMGQRLELTLLDAVAKVAPLDNVATNSNASPTSKSFLTPLPRLVQKVDELSEQIATMSNKINAIAASSNQATRNDIDNKTLDAKVDVLSIIGN